MTNSQETKQNIWARHIDAWVKTSLSQKAYCREHDLQSSQFSYWKKKLSREKSNQYHHEPAVLVPVVSQNMPASQPGLTLSFPSGVQLAGINANNAKLAQQLVEGLL